MTYPTHLSPDELERWAYVNGDTLTARLAGDISEKDEEIETADSEKDELEKCIDRLNEKVLGLEVVVSYRDDRITELENELEHL